MQTTTIIDGVEVIVWNSVFEKDRENPFCVQRLAAFAQYAQSCV